MSGEAKRKARKRRSALRPDTALVPVGGEPEHEIYVWSLPKCCHVRSWRATAPRVGLLVRAELAHHIQPRPSHPGTLRNPRRPTGRGIVSGGMMRALELVSEGTRERRC